MPKTLNEILVAEIKEWREKSPLDHGNTKSKWVTSRKWDSDDCGYSWTISSVEEELRAEAKKWLNSIKDGAVKDWIMHFFNL